MRINKNILIILIVAFILHFTSVYLSYSQQGTNSDIRKGIIKGRVIDEEVKTPIPNAKVQVVGTSFEASTDTNGIFTIPDVPVGSYSLELYCQYYASQIITDVIVKSKRITSILVKLKLKIVLQETITVKPEYFSDTEEQPNSSANFSYEEIRRGAGSGGDVSRLVSGLPSIARVNDTENSLVVRGGSPAENAFYIDNIEIPNINHYPIQGSTGGPIGLLNVEFIQDVNFYSGGFSSIYGDRLSSVMEINFREGNRDEYDFQLDMNMAGFGFLAEGPLPKKKGSWIFSARRSYIDLLVDAIGTGVAPKYGDIQGKIAYDLNKKNKLTVLGVMGIDNISWQKEDSLEDGNPHYGDFHSQENTIGFNLLSLWGINGYSNTSISQSYTKYEDTFIDTISDEMDIKDQNKEKIITLRNINYYRLNESNKLCFGFEAKHMLSSFNSFIAEYTDVFGNIIPDEKKDINISTNKYALFFNYTWYPIAKLALNIGARGDYLSYNQNYNFSPRFSLSYKISDKTSINGAAGVFYQHLPLILLFQNEANKNLKNPVAYHFILGINHLLTANTRLTIEVYDKEYHHFPLNPSRPSLFVVDELIYHGGISEYENILDTGKARSYGIEFLIQKKLAEKLYGLLSISCFRAKYRDLNGIWRNRLYDNIYIFNFEGGYKLNKKWEFSWKWNYAGGAPYTPYNIALSKLINSGIYDRNRINAERLPAYHSLNLRIDRRFNFRSTNLIAYFSVWNVYHRKNVAAPYWNTIENMPDEIYQWGLLPIGGLEFEF